MIPLTMSQPSAAMNIRASDIERLEAIRLLVSPLRNDMIVAMLGAGPCSVTDLATWLERPPSSLYFHMEKLEAAGLVEQVGVRRKERHKEALYAPVAANLRVPQDDATEDGRKLRARVAATGLGRMAQRVEQALAAGWSPLADGAPSVGSLRSAAWLDEAGLARFRELTDALMQLVNEAGEPDAGKTPINLALAFVTHQADQADQADQAGLNGHA